MSNGIGNQQKFTRDFEITEELQKLIDQYGNSYVQDLVFEKFCTQVINDIASNLNLTINQTTALKQVVNPETGELEQKSVPVFRFEIDKITIKKKQTKQQVTKNKPIFSPGSTPREPTLI